MMECGSRNVDILSYETHLASSGSWPSKSTRYSVFVIASFASPTSPRALCSSLHSSERPFACPALSATGRECSIGKH